MLLNSAAFQQNVAPCQSRCNVLSEVAIQVFLKKENRFNLHFLLQKSRNETKEIVSYLKCFIYQRNIVAKVATKLEFSVAKFKVLVALATVSVAISSPVFVQILKTI